MNYNIIGRSITVKESIKEQVGKKFAKLESLFTPETTVTIVIKPVRNKVTVEATIPIRDSVIRAENTSDDLGDAIELVAELLEKQVRRHRGKLIDKHHGKAPFSELFAVPEENIPDDNAIIIEKTKRFPFKPMDPEEACLQMELTGHSFFVFINAETEETCVVYKRKNGTYGLIEPDKD